jgi:RecA/RadA recombinase
MVTEQKPLGKRDSEGLAKFREKMEKKYGKRVTRRETRKPYEVVSTGLPGLDWATGVGGLVCGRIALYWGDTGAGKTTASILAMREAQKKFPNKMIVYIDVEHTFDTVWAEKLGLNTDAEAFEVLPAETSEEAADMLKETLLNKYPSPCMVVVDSVGGMMTAAVLDEKKGAGDSVMGRNAQIITRMCQMTSALAARTNAVVLLISQVRADMGSQFDTFAGPKNLRHSLTQRFKFASIGKFYIAEGISKTVEAGKEIRVKVERSKVAGVEGRAVNFIIRSRPTEKYGPVGTDPADEIRVLVDQLKLLPKTGTYYEVAPGERINGANALKEWLYAHPDEMEKLRLAAIQTQESYVIPDIEVEMVEEEE